jgi:hypothetical protein
MTTSPDSLDALIAASAELLGIAIDPSWAPAVKANLDVILRQAAVVEGFALPDDAEPAPVFTA